MGQSKQQRRNIMRLLVVFAALMAMQPTPVVARECVAVQEDDIAQLFERWSTALETQHPDRVTRLYDSDAMVIVGQSAAPRMGYGEIRDYYFHLVQRNPRVRLQSRMIRLGCNQAIDAGTAAMVLRGAREGTTETIMVRYTFVYEFSGDSWRIVHHHVSQPQEAVADRLTQAHAPLPAVVGARVAKPGAAVAGYTKRIAPRVPLRAKSAAPEPTGGYRAGDWSTGEPVF